MQIHMQHEWWQALCVNTQAATAAAMSAATNAEEVDDDRQCMQDARAASDINATNTTAELARCCGRPVSWRMKAIAAVAMH